MNFRISDTFASSLTKLDGNEQRSAKTTAFDLQMNPAHPGLKFHKINGSKDHNFSSVRVSRDIRLIVHQTQDNLLLCYVGHHDDAYRWAERRKIETHPKTGAAQLVEVRERVQEISVPRYVEAEQVAPSKPLLFVDMPEEELLGYGVPEDWLEDVQQSDEDSLLELADHLPAEAAEALLELATGGVPQEMPAADEKLYEMPYPEVDAKVLPANVGPAVSFPELQPEDPFEHPDAKRRFRVMNDVEELERALEYPWERWTVFLHPEQRRLVERDYSGPARVSGSAGTGKTVVALHRAAFLARTNPDSRVLLTTFSDALANSLRTKLMRLISSEPRLGERLEVHSMDAIGERLYKSNVGPVDIAPRDVVRDLLEGAADAVEGHRFSLGFLLAEWEQVVDAWQVATWEEYRDVRRLG
jgi:mRNA-degrading endonuclease RelE of RelBE toxin-antitoxin system